MKKSLRNIMTLLAFIGVVSVTATSCYEQHYYRDHHDHSPRWHHHHDARVDVNIHN